MDSSSGMASGSGMDSGGGAASSSGMASGSGMDSSGGAASSGGGGGGAASSGGGGGGGGGAASGAASGAGFKRSAPMPARPAKRAAAGGAEAASSSGSLRMGPLIGAMVREYLRPVYVYTVTSSQAQYCCGGGGDTKHGVFGSALLARGAARKVLLHLYQEQEDFEKGPCNMDSFLDLDEYSGMRMSQLCAACEGRGLECEGVKAAALRDCLRRSDRKARVEAVRAAARAADGDESGEEENLENIIDEEFEARYDSAIQYYLSGALDAGKAFKARAKVFEERWGGEDTGGYIEAPKGGSCCWGSVAATITVTRAKVQMHPKAEEEEGEEEEEVEVEEAAAKAAEGGE